MARPPKREFRQATFRCIKNGHVFVKPVWQSGQTVEERDEPTTWTVEAPDAVRCPECGSRVEVLET